MGKIKDTTKNKSRLTARHNENNIITKPSQNKGLKIICFLVMCKLFFPCEMVFVFLLEKG